MPNLHPNSTNYVHSYEPNTNDLTMAMDYNAQGQPVLRTQGNAANINIDIAAGLVPGASSVFVQGFNPNTQNSVEESIWCGSNLYPWGAFATPNSISAVSNNAADTGQLIITGLDSNFELQSEILNLNGTVGVTTTSVWSRIHSFVYQNSNGVSNLGTITAQINSVTVGVIFPNVGSCRYSQYTVPAGYTGYLVQGTANIGRGHDGTGFFKYRLFGSSFVTAFVFSVYQNQFSYRFSVPLPLPEKTDLDVTIITETSGSRISVAYDLLLIKNV